MLNNHQRKASLGLTLWVTSMYATPAQDLLQDVPTLPPVSDAPALPDVIPDLPGTIDPLPGTELPPITPPSNVAPDAYVPPSFIPESPAASENPLIPGSDLLPSTAPSLPGDNSSDDLLTNDSSSGEASFIDGRGGDDDREVSDVIQGVGSTSFNGQERGGETEGWTFGVRLIESYTSNLQLGNQNNDATLFTQISPSFSYRSAPDGEARFILAASYTPTVSFYHSGSEGTTYDHDFQTSLTYEGEKLVLGFSGAYSLINAPNRFTGAFTRSINRSLELDASYSISEKTTLYSNLEYQTRETNVGNQQAGNDPDGNPPLNLQDSDVLSYTLSALWDVSPKLQFGPGFRYANSKSGVGTSRSIALTGDVRYSYSDKTRITASLGLEESSFPGSSDEISPTGSIRVDYRPSPVLTWRGEVRYESIPLTQGLGNLIDGGDGLGGSGDGGQQFNAVIGFNYRPGSTWSFNGNLSRRTAPSFIGEGNIIDTSISLGANRVIGRGSLGFSVAQSFTDSEGGGMFVQDDQEFTQLSINYRHPSILENLSFESQLSYSKSTGGISFDQTSASIGLGYQF